jgi:cyclopropane-fatty-acyl-phospholipid synthase
MSTTEEIAITYDLPHDFYALWLDRDLSYTCAVFEADEELELAQRNKLAWAHDAAAVTPEKHVLDIGCGWGANMAYLTRQRGVRRVTGITLSRTQYDYVTSLRLPGAECHFVDYRRFEPPVAYDALISLGMFEHVATPDDARTGRHREMYRDYFRWAHAHSVAGARFALQSVIGGRIPRDSRVLREIGWTTHTIFPGAIAPRLEAIVATVGPWWEVAALRTRRRDYARTTTEWLRRLRNNEATVKERWGSKLFDEYVRYLSACVMAFSGGYQSLLQLSLQRADDVPIDWKGVQS